MKNRFWGLLAALMLLVALSACGSDGQSSETAEELTPAATESATAESAAESAAESTVAGSGDLTVQAAPDESAAAEAELDLTQLSSTMVYSEVFNMMNTPKDYIGKIVKMRGQFGITQYVNEDGQLDPDRVYYTCVIADATACCQQGLEFVLDGDAVYPQDYPELGTEITVVGEFQTYDEDGYLYCHLIHAYFD